MSVFSKEAKLAVWFTQPHIEWVLRAGSLGVKWLMCEANHSPPCSAEVKNERSYTSISPCASMM